MMYTFDKANAERAFDATSTQYFEMMGDHAIYHDGWIASTKVDAAAVGCCRRREPGPGRLTRRSCTT